MKIERTKNTIRNIFWLSINKIVLIIFPFIVRSIIIKELGVDYLGLSSLFISILQVLNITELGFTSAIVYSLYKPIAENDKAQICAIMNFYKKVYRIIGIIILILGLIVMPFLNNIINGEIPGNVNIYVIYLMFLSNTVISYLLFAYKSALLTAHQRNDITSNINSIISITQYSVQIVILCVLKNFYLYVIVMPILTIINNIVVAIITKKKYPEYICDGQINIDTKKSIKEKVSGIMLMKICQTTRTSLDSVFISIFLGLSMVAVYNNYYTIMSAILLLTSTISTSMFAGVGNSIVTNSREKNYNDMKRFDYMYMILMGWCSIALLTLYQPFMELWLGEEYLLPFGVVVLLVVYFYSLKMGDMKSVYLESAGLWWEVRYRAIAETIANVALNIILGKLWGLYGIVAGTLISLLIINFGYGSQIVFKHYFKNNKLKNYFISHFKYFLVTAFIAIITLYVSSFISIGGIAMFIIKVLVTIFVPAIMYFLIYFKSKEFEETYEYVKAILIRMIGNRINKRKE